MTISVTYRNGAFVPVSPISLPEGTQAEVVVVAEPHPPSDEEIVARMKAKYPGLIGSLSKEAAEELEKIIDEEFGRVNPDDWG